MYEPRWYRDIMGERFRTISFSYLESDLWVAFDSDCNISDDEILNTLKSKIISLRELFEDYFKIHPEFKSSFQAMNPHELAPDLIRRLAECSQRSKVGPMAGIAGLFAQEVGKTLKSKYELNEIIVENGGDLYINIQDEINVKLYAGEHPLSNKLSLKVHPKYSPLGLCASSGKFGHSTSLGKADLLAVACRNTMLADQLATAFANHVKQASDIQEVIDMSSQYDEILHLSIFVDKQFGMKGKMLIVEG